MQPTDQGPSVYLIAEALDRALDDKLGRRARQGARAEFLKVDRTTWWRYATADKVNADFIGRVLHALPDANFYDLFAVQDEHPQRGKQSVRPSRRSRRAELQDVAA